MSHSNGDPKRVEEMSKKLILRAENTIYEDTARKLEEQRLRAMDGFYEDWGRARQSLISIEGKQLLLAEQLRRYEKVLADSLVVGQVNSQNIDVLFKRTEQDGIGKYLLFAILPAVLTTFIYRTWALGFNRTMEAGDATFLNESATSPPVLVFVYIATWLVWTLILWVIFSSLKEHEPRQADIQLSTTSNDFMHYMMQKNLSGGVERRSILSTTDTLELPKPPEARRKK